MRTHRTREVRLLTVAVACIGLGAAIAIGSLCSSGTGALIGTVAGIAVICLGLLLIGVQP